MIQREKERDTDTERERQRVYQIKQGRYKDENFDEGIRYVDDLRHASSKVSLVDVD